MKQLMVDIETLGTVPGSIILSIGAVVFDREQDSLGIRFFERISVADQLLHGMTYSQSTIDFWRSQPCEAKDISFTSYRSGDVPLTHALEKFSEFYTVSKAETIWANGTDFDLGMLKVAYDRVGLTPPWKYNAARDLRTAMQLLGIDNDWVRPKIPHCPLSDSEAQAMTILRMLNRVMITPPKGIDK